MKLTNRDAQRTYGGLRRLEEDAETRFEPEVRMKIAVNIDRLLPIVRIYEKEVNRVQSKLLSESPLDNGERKIDPIKQLAAEEDINRLAEVTDDFKLKKFVMKEFNLKANVKIKGETLAQIALLIKDLDDGSDDEEA